MVWGGQGFRVWGLGLRDLDFSFRGKFRLWGFKVWRLEFHTPTHK